MAIDQCTETTCPTEGGYFDYSTSKAGNGIMLTCFIGLVPFTVFLGIRYRTVMFSTLVTVGMVFEVVCYVGRLLLHDNQRQTNYFVLFMLGSAVGPAFMTAAIFYLLPKVMKIYDGDLVDIQPKNLHYLFFALSLLSLTLQAVGSVFAAVGQNDVEVSHLVS